MSHKFASNVALIDGVKSCPLLRNSELDEYKDVEKKAKRTKLVHKFNVSAGMQVSRGQIGQCSLVCCLLRLMRSC